jgi:hypothetical protein
MTTCCSRFTHPATARSKNLMRVGSIRRRIRERVGRDPRQQPLGIAGVSVCRILGQHRKADPRSNCRQLRVLETARMPYTRSSPSRPLVTAIRTSAANGPCVTTRSRPGSADQVRVGAGSLPRTGPRALRGREEMIHVYASICEPRSVCARPRSGL